MDYGDASGRHLKQSNYNDKHLESSPRPRVSLINQVHGSGKKPDSETHHKEPHYGTAESSGYSANSSSDDAFKVNPQVVPKSRVEGNISNGTTTTRSLIENEKADGPSDPLHISGKSVNGSSRIVSRLSDIDEEASVKCLPAMLSPTTQVMERPEGFDPNRIPSSIFSRPSSPLEWSVASNDSLFSIRIGNNSLSRDHRIFSSQYKSGELPISGKNVECGEELCQSRDNSNGGDVKSSSELLRNGQTPLTTKGEEVHQDLGAAATVSESTKCGERITVGPSVNNFPKTLVNKQVVTWAGESKGPIANHDPDKSETIFQSSALPKKKKSSCPLQAICCFKWLSCCCSSPLDCSRCKCVSWPGNCSSCKCKCWPGSCSCCKCKCWPGSCSSCKCFHWPVKLSSCNCFHWTGRRSSGKFSCCSCKCLSCTCSCCSGNCSKCKWSCCSGGCPDCNWSFCSCNCLSCKWFTLPVCSFKWFRNCFSCQGCSNKGSNCCFKCPSWSSCCCSCPFWPSCNCRYPNCTWARCNCWSHR